MLVAGEDTHDAGAEIPGDAREFGDVLDLHLALRDVAVFGVAAEVVVPGDHMSIMRGESVDCIAERLFVRES